MKIFYLNNEVANGKIEFRVNGESMALVHFFKDLGKPDLQSKVIPINQREALLLSQAIQDTILKKVG